MIAILGYNFTGDKNALDAFPTSVNQIDSTKNQGGIYNHINITANTTSTYPLNPPTTPDNQTILNCNFNGNISGGSLDDIIADITSVRIKRRKEGDFEWTIIADLPVHSVADLSFAITDNFAVANESYEYLYVPMIGNVEGAYGSPVEVDIKYKGIFICGEDDVYRLYGGATLGSTERVQQVGVFNPYGRKYPVFVSNGLIDYETGSVSGAVLPNDYYTNGKIDSASNTALKTQMTKFLVDKKAKVVKDGNGNAWLCFITSNPSVTFDGNVGDGMMKISAQWTEMGDVNDKHDLFAAGLIPTDI